MNVIEYQGFHAKIEYDGERNLIVGRLLDTRSDLTFETAQVREVDPLFHKTLDDYLNQCKISGVDPHKSYNGSFNLRIPPDLMEELCSTASKRGITINRLVNLAVEAYLNQITQP